MGGRGSGGRRIGSGRKQLSDLERAIGGQRGVVLQHPRSTAVAPVVTFNPPTDCQGPALTVWHELAPHAFEARTLTPATIAAFTMLCRGVVKERTLSASAECGNADHRGLMQRVATWMKDFSLAPFGKPMYAAQVPTVNPLERFTKPRGVT